MTGKMKLKRLKRNQIKTELINTYDYQILIEFRDTDDNIRYNMQTEFYLNLRQIIECIPKTIQWKRAGYKRRYQQGVNIACVYNRELNRYELWYNHNYKYFLHGIIDNMGIFTPNKMVTKF